jgi:uncharacterized protein (DUF1684 family)
MKHILFLLSGIILFQCAPKREVLTPEQLASYTAEIQVWDQKRIEELKGPKGWLNLAGLFWLNEGINTVGSGPDNTIVFPEGKIPARAGFYLLKDNLVVFEATPKVVITSKGIPVTRMTAFHPDSAAAPVLAFESLQWFIIKRDRKYGIRLRDMNNPALVNFTGVERYSIDPAWRLQAVFEKTTSAKTIDITNILGQTTPQASPGTVVFTVDGKEYKLDALDEGGEEYFMIFGDSTNTHETYGAGRYLYIKKPDAEGKTVIDFNKAYNPPCAFTSFATCPLPPKQNILPIAVKAGEKNYGKH